MPRKISAPRRNTCGKAHRTRQFCGTRENGKWYGLLTDIPAEKLGLPSGRTVHILNVKCSPLETGSLLQKAGIFPAYHMNKTHWVTVLLDGTLPEPELFWLLEESYSLSNGNQFS